MLANFSRPTYVRRDDLVPAFGVVAERWSRDHKPGDAVERLMKGAHAVEKVPIAKASLSEAEDDEPPPLGAPPNGPALC